MDYNLIDKILFKYKQQSKIFYHNNYKCSLKKDILLQKKIKLPSITLD